MTYSLKEKSIAALIAYLGTSAVAAIAFHVLGIADLYMTSRFVVLPAFVGIVVLGLHDEKLGKNLLRGWFYGVLSVLIYDLSRIPFILLGWDDFIPVIGDWMMGHEGAHGHLGYLWRYIGNGGGLGLSCYMFYKYFKPKLSPVVFGVLFGLSVWLCLDIVLLFESAREMMFEPTVLNVAGSFTGHLVFGLSLGLLLRWEGSKKAQ